MAKGDTGATGATGAKGEKGDKGDKGADGEDGEDGQDGLTPTIGNNGNWWIGSYDTGVKAQGAKGETGATGATGAKGAKGDKGDAGEDGEDGLTPFIGSNGNWWIGTTDTGVKAQGTKGDTGAKGDLGLSAYEIYKKYYPNYSGTEKQWISDLISGNLGTVITHNITFDSNGGSPIPSQSIREGRKISEPENPTKEGYVFDGWYYQGEAWSFIGFAVTDDITLTARWKQEYTEGLEFILLGDGTYTVSAGSAKYLSNIIMLFMVALHSLV